MHQKSGQAFCKVRLVQEEYCLLHKRLSHFFCASTMLVLAAHHTAVSLLTASHLHPWDPDALVGVRIGHGGLYHSVFIAFLQLQGHLERRYMRWECDGRGESPSVALIPNSRTFGGDDWAELPSPAGNDPSICAAELRFGVVASHNHNGANVQALGSGNKCVQCDQQPNNRPNCKDYGPKIHICLMTFSVSRYYSSDSQRSKRLTAACEGLLQTSLSAGKGQ